MQSVLPRKLESETSQKVEEKNVVHATFSTKYIYLHYLLEA